MGWGGWVGGCVVVGGWVGGRGWGCGVAELPCISKPASRTIFGRCPGSASMVSSSSRLLSRSGARVREARVGADALHETYGRVARSYVTLSGSPGYTRPLG